LTQQEHNGITSLSNRITATIWAQCCTCGNGHYKSIISYLVQINKNKEGSTAPFINNLGIAEIFKDEAKEEEVSVIDFIN